MFCECRRAFDSFGLKFEADFSNSESVSTAVLFCALVTRGGEASSDLCNVSKVGTSVLPDVQSNTVALLTNRLRINEEQPF